MTTPRSRRGVAWFVYLARCADDSLYCGITNDIAARVAAHNAGKGARYTRTRRPIEVLYTRRCASKGRALQLEYRIKQLSRTDKQRVVIEPALLTALLRRIASRMTSRGRATTRPRSRDRRSARPTA